MEFCFILQKTKRQPVIADSSKHSAMEIMKASYSTAGQRRREGMKEQPGLIKNVTWGNAEMDKSLSAKVPNHVQAAT